MKRFLLLGAVTALVCAFSTGEALANPPSDGLGKDISFGVSVPKNYAARANKLGLGAALAHQNVGTTSEFVDFSGGVMLPTSNVWHDGQTSSRPDVVNYAAQSRGLGPYKREAKSAAKSRVYVFKHGEVHLEEHGAMTVVRVIGGRPGVEPASEEALPLAALAVAKKNDLGAPVVKATNAALPFSEFERGWLKPASSGKDARATFAEALAHHLDLGEIESGVVVLATATSVYKYERGTLTLRDQDGFTVATVSAE